MAYTKTTWENGDLITAEKLNKLEQGVANIFHLLFPVNVININNTMTPDKTYAEVCALMDAGRVPIYIIKTQVSSVIEYYIAKSRSSSRIEISNRLRHGPSGIYSDLS